MPEYFIMSEYFIITEYFIIFPNNCCNQCMVYVEYITNVDVDNITNVAGGAKQKAALSKRNSKSQHKGFSGVEEQT